MNKLVKRLGFFIAALLVLVGALLFSARFLDGPIAIVSGGPFTSGEVTPAPDDWSFLIDRPEIEFQTLSPATSRTVWLSAHDNRLFLVSGYMTTGYGSIWKQWPHYLENDDRVILRIDGKLYEQKLQRVMNGPDILPVLNDFSRKYGGSLGADVSEVTEGHTWMFEVVDRE